MQYRFKDKAMQLAAECIVDDYSDNTLVECINRAASHQYMQGTSIGVTIHIDSRELEPVPVEQANLRDKIAELREQFSMHDIMVELSATIND